MNITVLDGFTANPGDLSWQHLEDLGNCQVFTRTPDKLRIERAKDADIILTNKTELDRSMIELLPNLKYIGVLATGYNVVDLDAAKSQNIIVTNVPAYSTQSVAQCAFSHILNLVTHTQEHSEAVKSGQWSHCEDFCFWNFPLQELAGQTLGIIGFGRIGQEVAKIANAFGMKLLVHTRTKRETDLPVSYIDIDTLFQESDFVSLHCPLTNETTKIVNEQRLKEMKPTAFLINTSRGLLIDEQALADALNKRYIAGAGLDVLTEEPPQADNPLFKAKHCYITPHLAWASREARARLLNVAISNVKAFIEGQPVNVVNS